MVGDERGSEERPLNWMLVPSPLLGPSTWASVGLLLERAGHSVCIPSPAMPVASDTDMLSRWLDELAAVEPPGPHNVAVVVGHSAACPRLPALVDRLLGEGWPVEAMVLVDGRFPDGKSFTESEPRSARMLDGLVRPDEYLPPWPRWWGSLVEGLVVDDVHRDLVFAEAKPIPRAWFDQAAPVPVLPKVKTGFISFGYGYQESRERARAAGWSTATLFGDHLHQVVSPRPVAATLLGMVRCMIDGPPEGRPNRGFRTL